MMSVPGRSCKSSLIEGAYKSCNPQFRNEGDHGSCKRTDGAGRRQPNGLISATSRCSTNWVTRISYDDLELAGMLPMCARIKELGITSSIGDLESPLRDEFA